MNRRAFTTTALAAGATALAAGAAAITFGTIEGAAAMALPDAAMTVAEAKRIIKACVTPFPMVWGDAVCDVTLRWEKLIGQSGETVLYPNEGCPQILVGTREQVARADAASKRIVDAFVCEHGEIPLPNHDHPVFVAARAEWERMSVGVYRDATDDELILLATMLAESSA